MIHNNLRKLLRTYAYKGTNTSNPVIFNYTDVTGYTGTSSDSTCASYINNTYFVSDFNSNTSISIIKTATSNKMYAQIGLSQNDEPDYNLGTTLSDNLTEIVTVVTNNGNIVLNTTINNITNDDIIFNEVGLFFHFGRSSSNYWNGTTSNIVDRQLLLIKEVLPQSMTLEANSSVSFAFNILGDV